MTYWKKVAEMVLKTIDQHIYTKSMLGEMLPKKAYSTMHGAERTLSNLRSDLEAEMFRDWGPPDFGMFYPPTEWRRYPQTIRYPLAASEAEWRIIAEEMDRCVTTIDELIDLISGRVRAHTLDRALKYRAAIIKAKMRLEPFAIKQIGDWTVLYRREEAV